MPLIDRDARRLVTSALDGLELPHPNGHREPRLLRDFCGGIGCTQVVGHVDEPMAHVTELGGGVKKGVERRCAHASE